MDSRLIFLHLPIGLHACDAVLELVTRIDVGVPQGRDRFDVEASNETAEKNHGGIASARTTN